MTSILRPVVRVAELMSTFRPWWALCGGGPWTGGSARALGRRPRARGAHPTFDRTTSGSYKGTAYGDVEMTKRRSHDDVDFETLRDRLSDLDERTWLRDSISRLYSNHPWLERLSDQVQDRDQP